jgi:hypothetical protein
VARKDTMPRIAEVRIKFLIPIPHKIFMKKGGNRDKKRLNNHVVSADHTKQPPDRGGSSESIFGRVKKDVSTKSGLNNYRTRSVVTGKSNWSYEREDDDSRSGTRNTVARVNMFEIAQNCGLSYRVGNGRYVHGTLSIEELQALRDNDVNDERRVTKIFLEQLNEQLMSELGKCKTVKIAEVTHRDDDRDRRIVDYSIFKPGEGEASNTILLKMCECKPTGFLPFKDDGYCRQDNTATTLVNTHVPQSCMFGKDGAFMVEKISEYLKTPMSKKVIESQVITLAFHFRDVTTSWQKLIYLKELHQ